MTDRYIDGYVQREKKKESESEVTQSCPTLCDPMNCSPPGSSSHGIFQARVLEWGATAFSVVLSLPGPYNCESGSQVLKTKYRTALLFQRQRLSYCDQVGCLKFFLPQNGFPLRNLSPVHFAERLLSYPPPSCY